MYATGAYQLLGSRYTQVGDQDLGAVDLTALPNTIGGPLTQTTFRFDPKLKAYDLLNLRVGLRRAQWGWSAYVNNATNELAQLALERERGTLARVPDQPAAHIRRLDALQLLRPREHSAATGRRLVIIT